MSILGMVVTLPQVTSVPVSPWPNATVIGDNKPPYLPSSTMSLVTMDYPYGMPTAMMTGLHTHSSIFLDNATMIESPFNPYLVSGSTISNTGRNGQPRGGFRYVPHIMPTFTTDSVETMRQQMDESNHKMINILN